MKIAIDISQIVHDTGVSFYTRHLIEALARLDSENDYLLFGYSLRQRQALIQFAGQMKKINSRFSATIFPVPPLVAEYLGHVWPRPQLERILGQVDVYHSSDWVEFPAQAAKLTTVHDFSFWKFPQTASPRIIDVMARRLKYVAAETDGVIAVSQATARTAVEMAGIEREKITVVYEAAADVFKPSSAARVKAVKEKYGLNHFFLAVANLDPRKNVEAIIEAFRLFSKKRSDWSLVLVGKAGWAGQPAPQSGVVTAGYVPQSELVDLYSASAGLVFPSFDEGFGLPVLEAMACGCPVLTSNCSSLPEVAGEAAVLVDPLSVSAISHGLEQLVADREKWVKAGFAQAAQFSWEKAARETLEVYNHVWTQKKARG